MTYSNTARIALLVGSLAFLGCSESPVDEKAGSPAPAESSAPSTTSSEAPKSPAPAESPAPSAPGSEAPKSPAPPAEPTPAAKPAESTETASASPSPDAKPAETTSAPAAVAEKPGVVLEPVKFDAFLARLAQNKSFKYTIVDAWASWCLPCKENFPHLLELDKKYKDKGLKVASLSFDDPAEPKQVNDAKKFLNEKNATITNFLLDEEPGVGNEKLNINAIPAVFIYDPSGKEVRRFTLDDPNHQFTYDDVEKAVVALLEGKPIPDGIGDKPDAK